jgi:hypothetical protein
MKDKNVGALAIKGYIVSVESLHIKADLQRITAYDLQQLEMRFKNGEYGFKQMNGNVKAVICEKPEDALPLLAKELNHLFGWLGGFRESVSFRITYSSIENGRTFGLPGVSTFTMYKISDYVGPEDRN